MTGPACGACDGLEYLHVGAPAGAPFQSSSSSSSRSQGVVVVAVEHHLLERGSPFCNVSSAAQETSRAAASRGGPRVVFEKSAVNRGASQARPSHARWPVRCVPRPQPQHPGANNVFAMWFGRGAAPAGRYRPTLSKRQMQRGPCRGLHGGAWVFIGWGAWKSTGCHLLSVASRCNVGRSTALDPNRARRKHPWVPPVVMFSKVKEGHQRRVINPCCLHPGCNTIALRSHAMTLLYLSSDAWSRNHFYLKKNNQVFRRRCNRVRGRAMRRTMHSTCHRSCRLCFAKKRGELYHTLVATSALAPTQRKMCVQVI